MQVLRDSRQDILALDDASAQRPEARLLRYRAQAYVAIFLRDRACCVDGVDHEWTVLLHCSLSSRKGGSCKSSYVGNPYM